MSLIFDSLASDDSADDSAPESPKCHKCNERASYKIWYYLHYIPLNLINEFDWLCEKCTQEIKDKIKINEYPIDLLMLNENKDNMQLFRERYYPQFEKME